MGMADDEVGLAGMACDPGGGLEQEGPASSLSDLGPRRVPPQPFRGHLLRNRDIILRK